MSNPTPKEYVEQLLQTGKEPLVDNPYLSKSPLVTFNDLPPPTLTEYFCKVLVHTLRLHPSLLPDVLSSDLSDRVKALGSSKFERPQMWSLEGGGNWMAAMLEALGEVAKDGALSGEALSFLNQSIEKHQSLLLAPQHGHSLTPLGSLIVKITKYNTIPARPESFDEELLKMMTWASKQEKQAIAAKVLEGVVLPTNLRLVLSITDRFNVALPSDPFLYQSLLQAGIDFSSGRQDKQCVIRLLADHDLRNDTLIKFMEPKGRTCSTAPEISYDIEGFCLLLPKEDIPPLIQKVISSPLREEDLPVFIQNHLQHHHITQGIQDGPLLKIKNMLSRLSNSSGKPDISSTKDHPKSSSHHKKM